MESLVCISLKAKPLTLFEVEGFESQTWFMMSTDRLRMRVLVSVVRKTIGVNKSDNAP